MYGLGFAHGRMKCRSGDTDCSESDLFIAALFRQHMSEMWMPVRRVELCITHSCRLFYFVDGSQLRRGNLQRSYVLMKGVQRILICNDKILTRPL